MGSEDQVFEGRMQTGSFNGIASLFIEKKYFSLNDEYADPDLADGPWSLFTVERDGQPVKRVFRRDNAGPEVLRELETAVDAAVSSTQLRAAPR